MAVERWRAECKKTRRQLNASEAVRGAMEQRRVGELQTALMEQQERLLQHVARTLIISIFLGKLASSTWPCCTLHLRLFASYILACCVPSPGLLHALPWPIACIILACCTLQSQACWQGFVLL